MSWGEIQLQHSAGGAVLLRVDGVLLLLRVDGVLIHHVAQVALAGGQQVVGARHEPGVLAPDM